MRSPVRTARVEPATRADHGRGLRDPLSVGGERLEPDRGIERPEDGRRSDETADDARLLEQDLRFAGGGRIDGGLGGHVPGADVLGERLAHDALELARGKLDGASL